MDEENRDNHLHLPSLSITGFRGIDSLAIERLGRVTLLAGKNSVGKTTILDAVRVYAARGHHAVLSELLENRDEFSIATDEDGNTIYATDFSALFHGRDVAKLGSMSIGPESTPDQLKIEKASLTNEQTSLFEKFLPSNIVDDHTQAFRVVFQNSAHVLPWVNTLGPGPSRRSGRFRRHPELRRIFDDTELLYPIGCESLGPGMLSNNEISRFWDAVALTDDENRAVQALRLILGSEVDRLAVIGDDDGPYRSQGRRVVVKLRNQIRPVPLKSLGDGALRLSGVALALTNSRDGFLLIDEAENGIHYSVQRDFWRMVLQAAHENNVQVIATTHSFDCVRGFAQAIFECNGIEGVLVRLERRDGEMWAVEYSENDLKIVAEQRIEVR